MSVDRRLIDSIKEHFARKSSAHLREIVASNDLERWSAEAIVAAQEVLDDRRVGRGEEPQVPYQDTPIPQGGHTIESLGLFAALNFLTIPGGLFILPINRPVVDDPIARDRPIPFGLGTAWLAVDSMETAAVAGALDLPELREATWAEGLEAARRGSVFVTPPVGEWTLVVSAALFPREHAVMLIRPLLERLSHQFGEAQYFCSHNEAGLHAWAFARDGRLLRGFVRPTPTGAALWDEGPITPEERELGSAADEECVLQLAARWSIDPTTLNEQYKEPVLGLLGGVAVGDGAVV